MPCQDAKTDAFFDGAGQNMILATKQQVGLAATDEGFARHLTLEIRIKNQEKGVAHSLLIVVEHAVCRAGQSFQRPREGRDRLDDHFSHRVSEYPVLSWLL